MNVFILGGNGTIGTAIVKQLRSRCHTVTGLSRSDTSARLGVSVLRGGPNAPENWTRKALEQNAVIQAAATFENDMGPVDEGIVDALIDSASARSLTLRVLYIGVRGCTATRAVL